MSDTTIVPATGIAPVVDASKDNSAQNAAFAALRQKADAAEAGRTAAETRLAELEARAQEADRAKLDETERLRLELKEAQTVRDAHGRFTSALERLYNEELETIPEEKREQVKALSNVGDWDSRVIAVRAAKALIPAPMQAQAMGSVTNPGNPGAGPGPTPQTQAPLTPQQLKNTSWGAVVPDARHK